jgi:hypothetical protein
MNDYFDLMNEEERTKLTKLGLEALENYEPSKEEQFLKTKAAHDYYSFLTKMKTKYERPEGR